MECRGNCVCDHFEIDFFFIQLVYCEWVILRLGHEYNQLLSIKLAIVSLHALPTSTHSKSSHSQIQFRNFKLLPFRLFRRTLHCRCKQLKPNGSTIHSDQILEYYFLIDYLQPEAVHVFESIDGTGQLYLKMS